MGQERSYPSAGHHIKDPGAMANGFVEMHEMDRFRNKLILRAKQEGLNYTTDENWETNTQYQSRIKPVKGDVLLDMHLDAAGPTASGCGVFVHDNASAQTLIAAQELVDNCSKAMGIPNRGVRRESQTARGKIGILSKGGITVLIEFGFITNLRDMKAFHDNEDCLVEIVLEWLIKWDKNK